MNLSHRHKPLNRLHITAENLVISVDRTRCFGIRVGNLLRRRLGWIARPIDTVLCCNGKMTDLGTLGGNFASAVAINEAGDVVGFQTRPGNDSIFHAALWKRGTIFDIGALQTGGCSLVTSVNSHLQVVGINTSDCSFDELSLRAVISEGGGPAIDLNTLIPADSGVQLRNASIINERGEIVAVGVYPDGNHGPVLLVPCESFASMLPHVGILQTYVRLARIVTQARFAAALRFRSTRDERYCCNSSGGTRPLTSHPRSSAAAFRAPIIMNELSDRLTSRDTSKSTLVRKLSGKNSGRLTADQSTSL